MQLDAEDVMFGDSAGENQMFFGDEIEMQNSFIDDRGVQLRVQRQPDRFADHDFHQREAKMT